MDELIGLSDQSQAEVIADHYEPVSKCHFPEYDKSKYFTYPKISRNKVGKTIKSMNKKNGRGPMRYSFEINQ